MIRQKSAIQEGVLRDIVELLSDNVDGLINPNNSSSTVGKLLNDRINSNNYFRNISKATSNLILTFPMIVDDSVSLQTASMVAKAVEKKIVLMLQMLFSAISVTNNKDAFDFVSKIHKNLTSDDVLSYINKMDSTPYKESDELDYDVINKNLIKIIKEDSVVLGNSIKPALDNKYTATHEADKGNTSNSNGKDTGSFINTGLDQSEIKKANEVVPSVMVIRFRSGTDNQTCGVAIIGVKVKMVYVNQADMIDRIMLKSSDQNSLFEFLKATTGEISMLKDFIFALNRAKLDIFTKSAKSSPIWKLLERRANLSRTNEFFNRNNGAGSAIGTLLISQDTMDILKKEHGFNSKNINKLINIMTEYSVMGFIITNDITEKIQMLFDDNSLSFETLSYSSLEREDKNQYKKIINLLAGK